MNKNICIVHYNTPDLTLHLIRSINKYVKKYSNIKIYIFDNSDTLPFTYRQDNIIYIDNTKGQIINFEEWGKNYPNRTKSFISSKHGYSVQKCMEIINEPFLLLDSDVLLKKDISNFFNESYGFIGELKGKRILPFICFINTDILKEKNVPYFDDNHTYDLFKNGPDSPKEDTGFMLYVNKEIIPHRYIKSSNYIEHYTAGSYSKEDFNRLHKGQITKEAWLKKFKDLWYYEEKDKISTPIIRKQFKDVFDHIYCLHYLPYSERLPILKSELKRVGIDENADYFSWKYDYPSPVLDLVFKKMNIDVTLSSNRRTYIKKISLRHYEIMKDALQHGYKKILIMADDIRFHKDLNYIENMLGNLPDDDVVMLDKMVSSSAKDFIKYRKYVKTLPEGTLYAEMPDDIFFIFASCYVLSEKAMNYIIKKQEEKLLPPDTLLNDPTLKRSFAVINLAIQDPLYKKLERESYNKIELDTSLYGDKDEILNAEKSVEKIQSVKEVAETVKVFKKPRRIIKPERFLVRNKKHPRIQMEFNRANNKKVSMVKNLKCKGLGNENKLYDS